MKLSVMIFFLSISFLQFQTLVNIGTVPTGVQMLRLKSVNLELIFMTWIKRRLKNGIEADEFMHSDIQ